MSGYGCAKCSLIDTVSYVVNRLNNGIEEHGVRCNEVLDDLLLVSYWFNDLSHGDLRELQRMLSILNKSILTRIEYGEKTLYEFNQYVSYSNLLEESERDIMVEILDRSLVLIKEKSYSLDFDYLYEILLKNKTNPYKLSFRRFKA